MAPWAASRVNNLLRASLSSPDPVTMQLHRSVSLFGVTGTTHLFFLTDVRHNVWCAELPLELNFMVWENTCLNPACVAPQKFTVIAQPVAVAFLRCGSCKTFHKFFMRAEDDITFEQYTPVLKWPLTAEDESVNDMGY
jgi:hypothetical protein